MKVSSHINNAYHILSHDLPRTIALLKIHNIELDLTKDTNLPHEFLFKQMEFYEAIDDVQVELSGSKNLQQATKNLEHIQTQVQNSIDHMLVQLGGAFETKSLDLVIQLAKQVSCYLKLKSRICDKLDKLILG